MPSPKPHHNRPFNTLLDVCGIISLNIYIMFCPQLATRNTDTLLCVLHVLPILLSGKLRNMRADYGIPWQAVVRTQYVHCCGPGSILGWGTKSPKSPGFPPPPPPSLKIKNWLKVPQYAVGLGLTPEPMLVTKTVFC